MSSKTILLIGMLAATAPAAATVNLIANGDFETGRFTGWTRTGALSREASRVVRTAAETGEWGARFSANAAYAGISQTFATPDFALTSYIISYSFRHTAGSARNPQYKFASNLTFPGLTAPAVILDQFVSQGPAFQFTQWQHRSFELRLAGPSTTLNFSFFDRYSTAWDLDNVSVTEVPFTTPVPEPSSWAMLVGGFALMGATLRRVRRNGRRAVA